MVEVQLLRDEIAALARLDSPHIVRIFEFAMDEQGVLCAPLPRPTPS